ncbi:C1 family peptidase [Bdellovibrio bacteriovorus]|uniref:C1 family peptidase n=1 Tax=Bdellovibrio bacteriovorus TaxID=959 RepID=UPI0035A74636
MKKTMFVSVFSLGLWGSFFAETAFAKQVDLRAFQTPAKEQGRRDTCAYFATTALVEGAIKAHFGQEYDISEEFEIFRHKVLNPWRPEVEFGNTYDLMKSFADNLIVYPEAVLPYQNSSPDFTKPLSAEQMDFYNLKKKSVPVIEYRSLKFKQLTKMWVNRPWSTLVMAELDQKRPVVITLKVAIPHIDDKKGTFTYNDAINTQCDSGQIPCGGHAVLLVGYDDERRLFMFKNSWGPTWGNEGYGYVTFDHVDAYSDQALTAFFDKLSGPMVRVRTP